MRTPTRLAIDAEALTGIGLTVADLTFAEVMNWVLGQAEMPATRWRRYWHTACDRRTVSRVTKPSALLS